jgi:SpoVK/Ycf46/Vps4 family AAA+-type ATPase
MDSLSIIDDYLRSCTLLIDAILQYHIHLIRCSTNKKNEYAGLTISDEEIDDLLNENVQVNGAHSDFIKTENEFAEKIQYIRQHISDVEAEAANMGVVLRICELQSIFNLSEFERDVLLLGLAPELSSKYEKMYAYIQNDITRKLPTVELVQRLYNGNSCLSFSELNYLLLDSPLMHFQLIILLYDTSRVYTPFASRYLKVDDRIVRYIFGDDAVDEQISGYSYLHIPTLRIDMLGIDLIQRNNITRLLSRYRAETAMIIYLEGASDADKSGTAEAICNELNQKMLRITKDLFTEVPDFHAVLTKIFREVLLTRSALFLDSWIQKHIENRHEGIELLVKLTERNHTVLFLQGDNCWEAGSMIQTGIFSRISLTLPSGQFQTELWKRMLNGHCFSDSDRELHRIQSLFKLNRPQISDVVFTAKRFAQERSEDTNVNYNDIYTACRIHSSSRMGNYARKITPKHDWNDIVLPAEKMLQLTELCNSIQYRSVVYGKWGFEKKLSIGQGISALFSGVSGTGKTMAAEIIANELHLELLKIDLSSVVSKYIGETEKNLSRIFDEAEHNNAILFFDEADAIMGKRSEVKDAHDRYSNIETAYLLQKLEEFSGVSLLATNFKQNIDTAFVRRIRYIIEFPFPDTTLRKDIWNKIWVPDVPLSNDIDIDFIARQFELSGGNIRNVAINAAFFAAEQETEIAMVHILRAVKRELQKIGKVCMDHDFGKYQHLIADKKTIEVGA